jgi:thymidylate synthase
MNVFEFDTINEGYIALVERLLTKPDDYESITLEGAGKGKLINKKSRFHLRNVHIIFKRPDLFTEFVVKDVKRSKTMNQYMQEETKRFDDGVIDSNEMGEISKIWKYIENPDQTINANYGYMVYHLKDARTSYGVPFNNYNLHDETQTSDYLSQFEWCQTKLKTNLHTLQAYMHFNRPKDQYLDNLDQPCTMYCQFMVVNNQLHFISNMRSNDIIYGTPYNLGYFVKLQQRMLHYLNTECNHTLVCGYLHHNATSLHLYEDKIPLAKKICGLY